MRPRNTMAATVVTGIAMTVVATSAWAQVPADPTPLQFGAGTKLKHGANSFAESQARDLLTQQGYSNISPLVNDKNGIWHGKAVKDQKSFDVSVDYQGRVAAE